ncbi:MAG: nucleoside hydrolase [Planctomycetaceae bacterium]|jgi:inosine-uridine nucleoside N-ribohydrolase|nr:nucleoside hydrolase [Planctomycetaceae bacterium]
MVRKNFCWFVFFVAVILLLPFCANAEPVRFIFDTDLGNDVDDAMAIAVIHALQNRNECELLAVTTTKDNPHVAPMVAVLNTFYGRPNIPIAVIKNGAAKEDGKYNRQVLELKDDAGKPRYSYELPPQLPEAVSYLRKCLAAEPDNSVILVQVGFFTNFARLLETPGDDISPLTGKELVAKKVKLLSLMAGAFNEPPGFKEYNVKVDIPSAKKMIENWPTEMIFSGHEIGRLIQYPPKSMKEDFNYVKYHPVKDAYHFYRGLENSQPTYDLTSVLYAVRPDRGYFNLSPKGTVKVLDDGQTIFEPNENGKHRFLIVNSEQIAMVREALVQLTSEPPKK